MSEVLFTARPTPTRRPLLLTVSLVVFFTLWHTVGAMFGASAATASTISGVVFEDRDRDGVADPGEPRWEGKWVYLYKAEDAAYVTGAMTNGDGEYEITGLAPGDYRAKYHPSQWNDVKEEWVPTTTDGVWPETFVTVDGEATFDLGWRPITTSSDRDDPITSHDAASGLRIESFTDAVSAEEVHAALTSGSLLGDERPHTVLRFGFPDANSFCNNSVSGTPGSYSNYKVDCSVSYTDWVFDRHRILFHEYGHAWSRYYEKIVNQWDDWDPYLVARGIDPEDERLGTSHAWAPSEMIAEDFRQLFGSPDARSHPQENGSIPPPHEVEGLATWLSTTFMGRSGDDVPDTTEPTETDTNAPTVSNLAPTEGSTLSGSVTATVHVDDDTTQPDGLQVSVLLDGVAHAATHKPDAGVWEAVLDTTTVPDGTKVVQARATDGTGNTAAVEHEVTVDNTDETSSKETSPSEDTSTTEESGPTVDETTSGSTNRGGTWTAWVDVTIVDGGVAASDVAVDATWAGDGKHGGSGPLSCTTDVDGRCRLSIEQAKRVSSVVVDITSPGAVRLTLAKP